MNIRPTALFLPQNNLKRKENTEYLTFQGKLSSEVIKRAQQKTPLVLGALLSIAEFIRQFNISRDNIYSAIENEKIELVGKKIDPENAKNKKFIEESKVIRSNERSLKSLKKMQFAKLLGVNSHTVDWHIKKGHIVLNSDGTIDATNSVNKEFLETFSRNTRKQRLKYTPDSFKALQTRLGKLPLEYCLTNGLIIAEEDGSIDFTKEANRAFLEKVEKKEISLNTYFLPATQLAKHLGISISTVRRALDRGALKTTKSLGIDLNDPFNKEFIEQIKYKKELRENNPSLLTAHELQELLGANSESSIYYQTTLGKLVRTKDGYYDISKEPNKSFIETFTTQKPRRKNGYKKTEEQKQRMRDRMIAPGHISQSEMGKMLGLSQTTLLWHNQKGHLHYVKGKGYDLSDPHNIYFIEHYVRGVQYTAENSSEVTEIKPEPTSSNKLKELDLNLYTGTEFAAMTGSTLTPILYHIDCGHIVRNADNMIDLSNPINKNFYLKHKQRAQARFETQSIGELADSINLLKKMFWSRASKEVYEVSKQLQDLDEGSLDSYLEYSFNKIVDTSVLNKEQKEELLNIFKEFVYERLESNQTKGYFTPINKIDFTPFLPILDNLIANKDTEIGGVSFMKLLKSSQNLEQEKLPLSDKETNSEIIESKSFRDFINIAQDLYSSKLRALNALESTTVLEMVDKYLFSKYIIAAHTGRLHTITNDINQFRTSEDLTLEKASIIAEKVLTQNFSKDLYKTKDYLEWKKQINPARIEYLIKQIIAMYKPHAMDKLCPDRVYELFISNNPNLEMSKDDFVKYLMGKFKLS